MSQSKIAFVALINNQDQPLFLKNFQANDESDIQFQLYTFTALEMIETQSIDSMKSLVNILIVKKRMVQTNSVSAYIGHLSSIFLGDGEYEMYGFCSATKNRIIVILNQKQNLEIYNESTLKQLFKSIHEVYLQDLFNPFHEIRNGLSNAFEPRLLRAVDAYERSL